MSLMMILYYYYQQIHQNEKISLKKTIWTIRITQLILIHQAQSSHGQNIEFCFQVIQKMMNQKKISIHSVASSQPQKLFMESMLKVRYNHKRNLLRLKRPLQL